MRKGKFQAAGGEVDLQRDLFGGGAFHLVQCRVDVRQRERWRRRSTQKSVNARTKMETISVPAKMVNK